MGCFIDLTTKKHEIIRNLTSTIIQRISKSDSLKKSKCTNLRKKIDGMQLIFGTNYVLGGIDNIWTQSSSFFKVSYRKLKKTDQTLDINSA